MPLLLTIRQYCRPRWLRPAANAYAALIPAATGSTGSCYAPATFGDGIYPDPSTQSCGNPSGEQSTQPQANTPYNI